MSKHGDRDPVNIENSMTDMRGGRHFIGNNFGTYGEGYVIDEPRGVQLETGYDNDDLPSYSEDAFAVGVSGSGASQLAAVLLYEVTEDPDLVELLHIHFMEDVVSRLGESWFLTEHDILQWVNIATDYPPLDHCEECDAIYNPQTEAPGDHDRGCDIGYVMKNLS